MLEVRPLAQGLHKAAVRAFCPSHLRVRRFILRPARNPRPIHRPSTARLESHCCKTHRNGPVGSTAAKTGVSSLALVSVFFPRTKLWEICTYKRIGSNSCRRGTLSSHPLPTNSRIVLSTPEPRNNCYRMCTYEIAKISYLESTLVKKWGWGLLPPPGGFFRP